MRACIPLSIVTLVLTFVPHPSSLRAQGSLVPPGAPAPTMKSLDQIEARMPISSAPFTITQRGSYYLTTNLTVTTGNAITVSTNGVTIDLGGFTISSTAPSALGSGISLFANDCTIRNGHIAGGVTNNGSGVYNGPGFGYGILGTTSGNIHVTDVSVSGCLNNGIALGGGSSTLVESCTVNTVGGYGIIANIVSRCSAFSCGNTAISAYTAADCYGYCTGSSGDGVSANNAANNCTGVSVGGVGVYVTGAAINCSGQSSSGAGISVSGAASNCYGASQTADGMDVEGTATSCSGVSVSGDGFFATVAIGCAGSSTSGFGIDAFIGNSCYGTTISGSAAEEVPNKYNMP